MEVRSWQAFHVDNVDNPAAPEADAPRGSSDLWRRLVWGVLALYLAPAFLIVLLVGGLAMVVLALIRVWNRVVQGPMDPGQGLGFVAPLRPHIGIVSAMTPRGGR